MNYIDIILGVILIAAAISGLRKGLIYEVTSLVALVLGIWGALRFSSFTDNLLADWFDGRLPYSNVIAFIITMVLIMWLVHLIGKFAEKIIKTIALGPVNRLLGLVFSFLKAAFVVSVILMIFQVFDLNNQIFPKDKRADSYLYQPVRKFAPRVLNFFSINFKDVLKDKENETEPKPKLV